MKKIIPFEYDETEEDEEDLQLPQGQIDSDEGRRLRDQLVQNVFASYCKCFSFCVVLFMYIFILCALLFVCTRPFCRVHVCYLDFALSLHSVVF
jgi:hypothetical protein